MPFSMRIRSLRECSDVCLDRLQWFVESIILLLGPLLIMLALGIAGLLTYTFFTILLPMLQLYHSSSLQPLCLGLHCLWVCFILVNVLFNYFLCVTTRNSGPHYDQVVRELAVATKFIYPETPAQILEFRRGYEDIMVLRMRRRRERAMQRAANASNSTRLPVASNVSEPPRNSGGDLHRRTAGTTNSTAENSATSGSPPPPSQPIRRWMLMGPMEWGYCGNTNAPKPPRSHYDHVTKSLVLNLDHYCPWMFNAIGYFNYRYFLNFLLYICVGMLYGAIVLLKPFMLIKSDTCRKQWKLSKTVGHNVPRLQPFCPYIEEKFLITMSFLLCAAVGAAVMMLAGFHVYLACTAQTTIEYHGNWANKRRAMQQGQKWKNPYSLGSKAANWQFVYGSKLPWYSALLPSKRRPEFLPIPVPGYERKSLQEQEQPLLQQGKNANDVEMVV